MRSWGIWLVVFGIGSFILPLFHMQFLLLSWMGPFRPLLAALMILLGAGLILFDRED